MKISAVVREVKVGINFGEQTIPVGRLAERDRRIYFQYEDTFLNTGLEISPFHLPLQSGLKSFDSHLFEGLPGVFNDSLPDGWGRLLFDRLARSLGIMHSEITPLNRLAHVGNHGLGALVYEPDYSLDEGGHCLDLDQLAVQAHDILVGTSNDLLKELLALNGSSAGARPKALIGLSQDRKNMVHGASHLHDQFSPWIVKFRNTYDGSDAGAIEYIYALMARDAGLDVPDIHLFHSHEGAGYFATKRFDRNGLKRLHMHTACGLLNSDFRTPSLDYKDLIVLTGALTRDVREIEKLYRLAVFNILAHNRDDHSKNFSFLMDEKGQWTLSPAYDLTFSSGPGGEQSTTVMGEGRSPNLDHLIKLGKEANIAKNNIQKIIDQVQGSLGKWKKHAKEYGVNQENIEFIANRINTSLK